jgi:hypothetical protein
MLHDVKFKPSFILKSALNIRPLVCTINFLHTKQIEIENNIDYKIVFGGMVIF